MDKVLSIYGKESGEERFKEVFQGRNTMRVGDVGLKGTKGRSFRKGDVRLL